MNSLSIKTGRDLMIMAEGGKKLAYVKKEIIRKVKPGVNAMEIEETATKLIEKMGGKPSFKMVQGYNWSTCVNINEGVVHGIPKKEVVFKEGDIVSVDVGIYYRGFHTDTSDSVLLGGNYGQERFLKAGRRALEKAIAVTKVGNKIGDISRAIEKEIKKNGYEPVVSLTGHGVGKELHEDPRIPCAVMGTADEKAEIVEGMALAIEVMYGEETGELKMEDDGWTISTKDGKMAALFEETVIIAAGGSKVITR